MYIRDLQERYQYETSRELSNQQKQEDWVNVLSSQQRNTLLKQVKQKFTQNTPKKEYSPYSLKSTPKTVFSAHQYLKISGRTGSNRFNKLTASNILYPLTEKKESLLQLSKIIKKRLCFPFQKLKEYLIFSDSQASSIMLIKENKFVYIPEEWQILQKIIQLKHQNLKVYAFERMIPIKLKKKLVMFVNKIENTWIRKNSEMSSFSFKKIENYALSRKSSKQTKKKQKILYEAGSNTQKILFQNYGMNFQSKQQKQQLTNDKESKKKYQTKSKSRKKIIIIPHLIVDCHCKNPNHQHHQNQPTRIYKSSEKKSNQSLEDRIKYLKYLEQRVKLEQDLLKKKTHLYYAQGKKKNI